MAGLRSIGHKLYSGDVSFDFVGNKRRWFMLSAVVLAIVIIGFGVRGLNLGIEFTGGAEFQAPAQANQATVTKVRSAVTDSGVNDLGDVSVSQVGSSQIVVETRSLDTKTEVPKVRTAISESTGTKASKINYNLIGPSWGSQITKRGIIAMVVFLGLVCLLLWAYMRDLKMSGAALLALLHDLIVTVGVYALLGFSFTPESLIGMLTILGYSLYDTVIVFDKLRENTRRLTSNATQTYSDAANLAVNQTLVRSINTTVIGVLPVSALLFAGGVVLHTGPLKHLSLALFVGMIAGTYSSIFLASPLLAYWKEREPDMIRQRKRVTARREREAGKAMSRAGAGGVQTAPAAAGGGTVTAPAGPAAASHSARKDAAPNKHSGSDPGSGNSTDQGHRAPQPATDDGTGSDAGTADDINSAEDSGDSGDSPGRRFDHSRSPRSTASSQGTPEDRARRGSLTERDAKRPQPQRKSRSERKK